jgi:hypothetical protein
LIVFFLGANVYLVQLSSSANVLSIVYNCGCIIFELYWCVNINAQLKYRVDKLYVNSSPFSFACIRVVMVLF